MQCSVCNEIITDPVQHCLECSIKPERSYNVGLITLEELDCINNLIQPSGIPNENTQVND